jgi:hypothetical protein
LNAAFAIKNLDQRLVFRGPWKKTTWAQSRLFVSLFSL